jgi:UDP-N-acetylglucosamine:LPS N-acetylglucosamine transferase
VASEATQVNADAERPLILVVLSGGGWYRETRRLLEVCDPRRVRVAYAYGTHRHHGCAELPTPLPGECHPIHYLGRAHGQPWRYLVNLLWLGRGFVEAYQLIRRLRPDAVLALGTAVAVPLFGAARLLRVRCVFVETLTRVRRLSRTGHVIYRLRLADGFYVQWPKLAKLYPACRFVGSVL